MTDAEFAAVQELMLNLTGQALEPHRRQMCELKLEQLARSKKMASVSELLSCLRGDASLRNEIVESLLNGETSFFRDAPAFRTLETDAFPTLARTRTDGSPLRVWSCASSTGQEAYSVAMLFNDSSIAASRSLELVATDYSVSALEKARAAEYTQMEVNRGLPAKLLTRHFERRVRSWVARPELRRSVVFERLDLTIGELPSGLWDLILLRNVLIYFPMETKRRVLERVFSKLAPGGVIMLGGSETAFGITDELVPASFGSGFFQKCESK